MEIISSLILPATAACFFYTAPIQKRSGPYISFEGQVAVASYPGETSTPNFQIQNADSILSDAQKYNIIKMFATNIIEASIDVEPEVVKFVNDNLWDLI
jgi:hypothetical protein